MNYISKKLVCGWGINDLDYPTQPVDIITGKQLIDPYYRFWKAMIERVKYEPNLSKRPNYRVVGIYEDWKLLSNFKEWVDSQSNKNWENCCLDKDIILPNSNIYSPDSCSFVSIKTNNFIGQDKCKGDTLIGVTFRPQESSTRPYKAQCSPFKSGDVRYIGRFSTEVEAHKAWQAKKHEYACQLADMQEDGRVAKALRERYAPDKDWTKC